MQKYKKINFQYINMVALKNIDVFLRNLLPDGRRIGHEWVARNPIRNDHKAGSFKVNLSTGRWSDFATGDRGGDLTSLYAYLTGISQVESAKDVAEMFNIKEVGND